MRTPDERARECLSSAARRWLMTGQQPTEHRDSVMRELVAQGFLAVEPDNVRYQWTDAARQVRRDARGAV